MSFVVHKLDVPKTPVKRGYTYILCHSKVQRVKWSCKTLLAHERSRHFQRQMSHLSVRRWQLYQAVNRHQCWMPRQEKPGKERLTERSESLQGCCLVVYDGNNEDEHVCVVRQKIRHVQRLLRDKPGVYLPFGTQTQTDIWRETLNPMISAYIHWWTYETRIKVILINADRSSAET